MGCEKLAFDFLLIYTAKEQILNNVSLIKPRGGGGGEGRGGGGRGGGCCLQRGGVVYRGGCCLQRGGGVVYRGRCCLVVIIYLYFKILETFFKQKRQSYN